MSDLPISIAQTPEAFHLPEHKKDFPALLKANISSASTAVTLQSENSVMNCGDLCQQDSATPRTPLWGAKEAAQTVHSPGNSTAAPESPHEQEAEHKEAKDVKLYHQSSSHHFKHKKHPGPAGQQYVEITFLDNKGQKNSFAICEHWCSYITAALKHCRELNIAKCDYDWVSHYTALHYAVSKYNVKMCEFLLEAPECQDYFKHYVHIMDDFYEKPIDHLANHKGVIPKSKEPLANYLQYFMEKYPADPMCEREIMYQDIKLNGPLHSRKEVEEEFDINKMVDESGECCIASGDTGPDLTNIMSAFEVENLLPTDMRKNFKIVAKSGFENFAGAWTKGESPLHWAAARGRVDVCRMLILVLKANPEAEDDKGRSPIKLAKVKKHAALAKMLHTLEFPIERDDVLKAKKEAARRNPVVAPTLKRRE